MQFLLLLLLYIGLLRITHKAFLAEQTECNSRWNLYEWVREALGRNCVREALNCCVLGEQNPEHCHRFYSKNLKLI